MPYLIAIAVSLLMLAGFLLLTRYETGRGVRFFGTTRARFDADIERIEFILAHIDLAAFLREEARRRGARLSHDTAHLTLRFVRSIERLLSRAVRRLRIHAVREDSVPREASREFVKALSDFKGTLGASRPETDVR